MSFIQFFGSIFSMGDRRDPVELQYSSGGQSCDEAVKLLDNIKNKKMPSKKNGNESSFSMGQR